MKLKNGKDKLPKQNKISQIHEIANKFICPVCNHKASINNDVIKCVNDKCGIEFPIIKDIPILINEADSIFNIKDYYHEVSENKSKINTKKIARHILRILPSLSNNLSCDKNFRLLEKLLSNRLNPKILIIGGGIITTKIEYLNRIIKPDTILIESDVNIGPRTQIIIDGHHIPIENNTFDLVIFQAVLEHVADPTKCVIEAHRVLKNDGIVFATTPFMQQVHGKEYDFTRFTYLGHRRLFRAFNEIESGVFAGTGVALGWSIKYFAGSLFNNKYIRFILQILVSFAFFWLKYIDYIIRNNKGTYNGASGYYFIGEKSNNILSDKELIKLYKGY